MKVGYLVLIITMLSACKGHEAVENKEQRTKIETTLILSENRIRYHQVPAVLLAEKRANLSFQLSGTINQVFIKVGENVSKGQALMSLYNPNIDPALDGNLAQLESIKAQIVQAKRDLANLKTLRKNNSASKNAYQQQETALKELFALKKGKQAQIDLALANLSESVIKAPFDGTIVKVNKQLGEFARAGVEMIMLFQQDSLEVEVNITRELWKNLKMGTEVTARYDDQKITFSVTELAQMADSSSHLMKVILHLETVVENLIGQQVILEFPEQYTQVFHLPLEAVVDDGINKPYIFTVEDDRAKKQPINPLYLENGQVIFTCSDEIKSEVVIKGQAKISEGMLLQAQK